MLDAQNSGSTYQWYPTNQITQTIVCTQSNLYKVVITGSNNCQAQSQVVLQLNAEVKPNLGNDTTVCGFLKLDAGYAGALFNWNNGANTQTVQAQQSGTYIINVTDQNNCSGSDSISITILPLPQISASSDIVQCRPKNPFTLSVNGSAQTYSWSTGQSGTSIQTSVSGFFIATGTSSNGCHTNDTVKVQVLATPSINLGGDFTSCDKKIIDIVPNGNTILWHDGSSASSFTAFTTQKVWIQLTNTTTACADSDTSNIVIIGYPEFDLGNDTISCSAHLLKIGSNLPNCTYLWNNTQTSATIIPQSSGLYALTISNAGGCARTDYINIEKVNSPSIQLGASIRYLCNNSTFTLNTNTLGLHNWIKDGQSLTSSSVITISEPGQYNVVVANVGCSSADSVLVIASNQTVQANFLAATYDTINRAVKFVNLSKPFITKANWDFGDGLSSSEIHPDHAWLSPTDYSVTLSVSNNYCSDQITKQLSLLFRDALLLEKENLLLQFDALEIYPNPNRGDFTYNVKISKTSDLKIEITSTTGQIIRVEEIKDCESVQKTYILTGVPPGLYFIKSTAKNKMTIISKVDKLIIEN